MRLDRHFGAERLAVELDRGGRVVEHEPGCHRMHTLGDWFDLLRHSEPPSRTAARVKPSYIVAPR
jgi:antibiotic biosynthesis monooxygenase (ABM) superfamily enzyme